MSTFSRPQRRAVPDPGPFPDQTIFGYKFTDHTLLNEAFVIKPEFASIDDQQYPDGNRRLALLGDTVIRTYICQMWYDATAEPRHSFQEWIKHVNSSKYLALLARKNGLDKVVADLGGILWSEQDEDWYVTHAGRDDTLDQRMENEKRMRDKQLARVVQALVAAVFNDSKGDGEGVQRFMWAGLGIRKPTLPEEDKELKGTIADDLASLQREVEEVQRSRVALPVRNKRGREEDAMDDDERERERQRSLRRRLWP